LIILFVPVGLRYVLCCWSFFFAFFYLLHEWH